MVVMRRFPLYNHFMKTGQNASDLIFDKIFMGIVTGEYPKGSRLPSEHALCEKYGVSRVTVRAALQRLLALELVETNIGGGTRVKYGSLCAVEFNAMIPFMLLASQNLQETLEFRQGLESMAAYYAAARATEDERAALTQRYEHMQDLYVLHAEESEYAAADFEFHRFIAHISHNEVLKRVTDIMSDFFRRQICDSSLKIGTEAGYYEHKQIYRSIMTQKTLNASFYAAEHITNTMERYQAISTQ